MLHTFCLLLPIALFAGIVTLKARKEIISPLSILRTRGKEISKSKIVEATDQNLTIYCHSRPRCISLWKAYTAEAISGNMTL